MPKSTDTPGYRRSLNRGDDSMGLGIMFLLQSKRISYSSQSILNKLIIIKRAVRETVVSFVYHGHNVLLGLTVVSCVLLWTPYHLLYVSGSSMNETCRIQNFSSRTNLKFQLFLCRELFAAIGNWGFHCAELEWLSSLSTACVTSLLWTLADFNVLL